MPEQPPVWNDSWLTETQTIRQWLGGETISSARLADELHRWARWADGRPMGDTLVQQTNEVES
jgi:hypothetical protein